MLNRRHLLASGAAAALAPSLSWAQAAADPLAMLKPDPSLTGEDARLDRMMMAEFVENLDESPESATRLGIDVGPRAGQRSQLNDRSKEFIEARRAEAPGKLAALKTIDRNALSPASKVTYDVAEFQLTGAVNRARLGYGAGFGVYVVSQQGGAYQSLPDWLDTQHPVKSAADADAYLSRLNQLGRAIDQESERIEIDAAKGVVEPDFIIDKIIAQLAPLKDTPGAGAHLSTSFEARTRAIGLSGYGARAAGIIDQSVRPAAARQSALFTRLRASATHDAGVWKLPDGEEAYRLALRNFVTTDDTAEEIHAIGLEQVADLQARLDPLLKAQGLTQGSVGERLKALGEDPRYLWANTDEAKVELIKSLNDQIADIARRLPSVFTRVPTTSLEIRRVPPSIEIGAPGGYYQRGSLDGSRPGAYYINLHDTADWAKWGLPTLSYHEGLPGHHFQGSLLQEAGSLPLYRRSGGGFSAYSEGWGLYAERVAADLGVYDDYEVGNVGYLQSYLFRATRLVVDTGLHHKRWSREQAIRFMMDNAAEPAGSAEREIDRYCVNPGQACSYKMGQTVIAGLRAEAEEKLGPKFDIKGFHDTVLLSGAVPLEVLKRMVHDWTATRA
jgi:uncharacterized protein (DUF885 family)